MGRLPVVLPGVEQQYAWLNDDNSDMLQTDNEAGLELITVSCSMGATWEAPSRALTWWSLALKNTSPYLACYALCSN